MKKNTLLIIGGVIVAYYLWKKSQETSETVIIEEESTSKASGVGSGVICERNGKISGCVRMCAEGDKVVGNCTLSSSLARR